MTSTAPWGFLHLQGLREVDHVSCQPGWLGRRTDWVPSLPAGPTVRRPLTDIDARVEEDRGQAQVHHLERNFAVELVMNGGGREMYLRPHRARLLFPSTRAL